MPRWYYLLVLRAMQSISVASLAVAGVIALCATADWLGHLGWGYPWYVAPFLILVIFVAFTVNRSVSALIKRVAN